MSDLRAFYLVSQWHFAMKDASTAAKSKLVEGLLGLITRAMDPDRLRAAYDQQVGRDFGAMPTSRRGGARDHVFYLLCAWQGAIESQQYLLSKTILDRIAGAMNDRMLSAAYNANLSPALYSKTAALSDRIEKAINLDTPQLESDPIFAALDRSWAETRLTYES